MWLERSIKNVGNLADEVEKLGKTFLSVWYHILEIKGSSNIAGKILDMYCMSLLLKMFHFIVKRLPFSREVCWIPMVLLCFFFSSNEPNGTRSTWAEKWQTWGPHLLSIWGQVQILGCLWAVGITKQVVSATSKEGESSVISHNVTWNLQNTFFICCLWHFLKGHSKIILLNQG